MRTLESSTSLASVNVSLTILQTGNRYTLLFTQQAHTGEYIESGSQTKQMFNVSTYDTEYPNTIKPIICCCRLSKTEVSEVDITLQVEITQILCVGICSSSSDL